MTDDLQVLLIVTGRLETAHIAYMLTGSVAANYYGVPRMTRDIDVVIDISRTDAGPLVELLRVDFYVEPDAVERAATGRLMFNAIHTALIVKVDFIVRKDSEYRREEFGRRRRVMIDGIATFVVAPEDLIPDAVDRALGTRWALPRGGWMNDTSPEMARKYRAMLLQRSGADRLKMGSSMFTTARTLLVASLRERNPAASPAAIRRALFLRFYGADFDAATRQRILAALGREPGDPEP